jgi:hypothetical protein
VEEQGAREWVFVLCFGGVEVVVPWVVPALEDWLLIRCSYPTSNLEELCSCHSSPTVSSKFPVFVEKIGVSILRQSCLVPPEPLKIAVFDRPLEG